MCFGKSGTVSRPKGGIIGIWSGASSGISQGIEGLGGIVNNSSTFLYIGLGIVAVVGIMMAYSFVSGKQNVATIVTAARS